MISIDILTSFDFFEANNKWKDACQFSLKVTFSIQTTHWFRRARIAHFFKLQFKYLRPSGGKHVLKDTIWDAWHFDFKSLCAICYFLVAQIYTASLSVCVNNLTHWSRLLSPLRTLGANSVDASQIQSFRILLATQCSQQNYLVWEHSVQSSLQTLRRLSNFLQQCKTCDCWW